jgi:riboflavin kinase/FMN adenylyltransferase
MRVFRGLPGSADAHVALTIGNFDGVHRGHQAMLSRLIEAAEDLALPPTVMTFDPHPREFFAPASAPPRLSSLRSKLNCFAELGVERTYIIRFDSRFAARTPQEFVDDVLVARLGARWVLVGEDFRFGRGRAGDVETLRSLARSFSVEAMRNLVVGGERASSSAVREALVEADFDRAATMLGRPYTIEGRVAHGAKLGRNLGFPTANIRLRRRPPFTGIYAVRVHGLGPSPRNGVASLGVRPTIAHGGEPLLEVYLFEFSADIYGHLIDVEFLHKIRDEARYPDLHSLTRQIRHDVERAQSFFAAAASGVRAGERAAAPATQEK